ncbi:vitamin K epoxide reductase family protein [Spirosoma panaciterrae]|uniref:vitamin K epoxide reductase family protein n=1 Tax=Spirosoma panaciterrae TaxID=496058 RepID=UPI0003748213|nr:vitamin K epoxide reductase family protein [Spirosoma panaciterrae]
MALVHSFLSDTDANASATLYALLKRMDVKVTRATVQESLERHPDFPSLLSLSDVLTDWQVESAALQLNTTEQFRELPFPFIAHLRKEGGWYVLVTALKGDRITYVDTAEGQLTESLADFEQQWSGVVLLAEVSELSGEPEYAPKRKQEWLTDLRGTFVLGSIGLLFLLAVLGVASTFSRLDWLWLLTKTVGLTLSVLLVLKQLGSRNTLTDRLCRINSKTNCDNVLNSPAAKLWGWLSWTDVGLLYFSGGLLAVFVTGIYPSIRPVLQALALLAVPYTLFSVYYQARVLRQWCTLCLGVQAVLLAEGTLAVLSLEGLPNSLPPYLLILTVFLLPTLVWVTLKPLLTAVAKSRHEHQELMGWKRNPELFHALLMQQPQMPPIPDDLYPIVLGNPDAEHTITMVTNPYCGPCARTHKELETLLNRNDNINAKIIFTCDGAEGLATQVAIRSMALVPHGKATLALRDWYGQTEKNVDVWVEKYPVDADGTDWLSVTERYTDWCRLADIQVTPTLFVDGYQLPEQYRLSDLRWLVNELDSQAINLS